MNDYRLTLFSAAIIEQGLFLIFMPMKTFVAFALRIAVFIVACKPSDTKSTVSSDTETEVQDSPSA